MRLFDIYVQTFARIAWFIVNAGLFWWVAWVTNPSLDSGDIWMLSLAVSLITYQMPVNRK